VEKGFLRTAFDQELIDPKPRINLFSRGRIKIRERFGRKER